MTTVPIYENISVEDYKVRFKDGGAAHVLVDVRTEEEFNEGRIPGAINIPLDEVADRLDELETAAGDDRPLVLVCRSGVRSIMGAQIIRQSGLTSLHIYNLETGTKGWVNQRWPLEYEKTSE